jgi:hypothetical protein
LRILAFDHFFDQDLDALERRLRNDEAMLRLPYQRLRRLAGQAFPERAFTGLDAAYEPDMDAAWDNYRPAVAGFADRIIAAHRPAVFVPPTDAIFYLRPLIEALSERGVPTVVVQKETTLSESAMGDHARHVGQRVPFMSAHQAVCSERQRRFWINAGTDPSLITVTGQPRFDVYARTRHTRRAPGARRLLYLSYDDTAYLPSDYGLEYTGTWRELRRETESVIAELAGSRSWAVTVKHHPQQTPADEWLGRRVRRARRTADTRSLITEADVVVGFQTTTVFEAAAAGRPVVYPAWGDVYRDARDTLVPFHEHPELVDHVTSADALRAALRRRPSAPSTDAAATYEHHLGPVDGRATDRVLDLLRAHAVTPRPEPATSPTVRTRIVRAGTRSGAAALRVAATTAEKVGRVDLGDRLDRFGTEVGQVADEMGGTRA